MIDDVFAGSVSALCDRYLVPVFFAPYAADLAARLGHRAADRVLGPVQGKMQALVTTAAR